jgi:2,4-dienoyl-CoA reductase-like NADH-dependent reductase (Old Yellow Enzyme family)
MCHRPDSPAGPRTGPLILNADYDKAKGRAALDADQADAISFGRAFLANPDLPRRFAEDIPLTPDNTKTWYTKGSEGYVD